jgi:hypothetical protein
VGSALKLSTLDLRDEAAAQSRGRGEPARMLGAKVSA